MLILVQPLKLVLYKHTEPMTYFASTAKDAERCLPGCAAPEGIKALTVCSAQALCLAAGGSQTCTLSQVTGKSCFSCSKLMHSLQSSKCHCYGHMLLKLLANIKTEPARSACI